MKYVCRRNYDGGIHLLLILAYYVTLLFSTLCILEDILLRVDNDDGSQLNFVFLQGYIAAAAEASSRLTSLRWCLNSLFIICVYSVSMIKY